MDDIDTLIARVRAALRLGLTLEELLEHFGETPAGGLFLAVHAARILDA